MKKLKTLKTGGLITSQISNSSSLFIPLTTVSEDLKNVYEFIKYYEGVFANTLEKEAVSIRNGIDGRNIFASKVTIDGFLYKTSANRPKTVSECLVELFKGISTDSNGVNVSAEIANIKNAVGLAHFHEGVPSSEESVDASLVIIENRLDQIAADIFNRGKSIGYELDNSAYAFNKDGKQTQSESIKDLLFKLLDAHGGISSIDHKNVKSSTVWAGQFSPAIEVIGGQKRFLTVFSNTSEASIVEENQRFYNPFLEKIKIKSGGVVIKENTLTGLSSVTLYINGNPTSIDMRVRPGEIGLYINDLSELELEPGDYVQFRVSTGSVPSGSITISNLSLTIQEI